MKFMDRVRIVMAEKRLADSTCRSYCGWVRSYIRFHGVRHPREMGGEEVVAYLNHLAVERKVAAGTQNQALNALVFLYRNVLGAPLPDAMEGLTPAKRRKRPPVVLSHQEALRIIEALDPDVRLPVKLMYGAGLRVGEALSLRIKDVDLEVGRLMVYEAKQKDRYTVMPVSLRESLEVQIERARVRFEKDVAAGAGSVRLPEALARKLPAAHRELRWQFLFPASRLTLNEGTGIEGRWHAHRSPVQKAVRNATERAGINKRVTCHTFRHTFATEQLRGGTDIRTIQRLLGHTSVKTTMIYTHILNRGPLGVVSPLDR